MNPILLLSALGRWLQRMACRWQEARRMRRDFAELATMSDVELRDIGISHASMAAGARYVTRCE